MLVGGRVGGVGRRVGGGLRCVVEGKCCGGGEVGVSWWGGG